ncbi:unnamed protein product [Ambrosiozyma monospora]|uniref:Eukaryotic translation initiation factor 3 subunit E n=1 Tax=Ambrosiozyma monospora TaxID=43982 RepID=A0A9W6Z150_AMBMO|nr:unnamed protein product [Ambrosiozyma monospora]
MSEEEIQLSTSEKQVAKKYDLTNKFIPFLDRPLVYPLIEHLEFVYDQNETDQWEYDLLKETYMIKFIKQKYSALNPQAKEYPVELLQKEKFVNEQLLKLDKETKKTLEILSSKEVQQSLKQDKSYNIDFLAKQYQIDDARIYQLYEFGKFQYNRGDYVMASDLMSNFRLLSIKPELNLSATWGKLSSDIITFNWVEALNEFNKLREIIDNRNFDGSTLDQLNKRTWLIHFSLYIFFGLENPISGNDEDNDDEDGDSSATNNNNNSNKNKNNAGGLDSLIDLFFSSSYMSTIQASCPWILRYLAVAILYNPTNKRLKDLVRAINVESYEFRDPFTELFEVLLINFEFEKLAGVLNEIKVLTKSDFFISQLDTGKLLRNVQSLILTTLGKVNSALDLKTLKTYLSFESQSELVEFLTEKKIKVENDLVVFEKPKSANVYFQIYEKTKAFNFKNNQNLNNAFNKQESEA